MPDLEEYLKNLFEEFGYLFFYSYEDYFVHHTIVEPDKPFIIKKEKLGRNDPCLCGSGKKYKKCCLGKEE